LNDNHSLSSRAKPQNVVILSEANAVSEVEGRRTAHPVIPSEAANVVILSEANAVSEVEGRRTAHPVILSEVA
jgi:hypothetical protein